jgi:hypothetical protein
LNDHGGGFHAACNLVDYIVNRVSVAEYPAFVDVTADENDFGHDRWVVVGASRVVDRVKLRIGEGSNDQKAHSISGLELFEIGANERGRFIRKRHQVESEG